MQREPRASITAIPTIYGGVMFRSRTEARFAHWCDSWSVEWEYEPQGYQIGDVRYLPDFFLPDCRTVVEIKPQIFEAETSKIEAFMRACCDPTLTFWVASMGRQGCTVWKFASTVDPPSDGERQERDWEHDVFFAACRLCGRPHMCSGTSFWECPHCKIWEGDHFVEMLNDVGDEATAPLCPKTISQMDLKTARAEAFRIRQKPSWVDCLGDAETPF